MEAILTTRSLVRSYGDMRVVDGLDLTVRAGEVYGFLGRNGAGKTTTIRMLMGIVRADAGTIGILGSTVSRPTVAHKKLIGYVAQEQHFYPWMTCRQVVDFVRGFYDRWDERELARLFQVFQLPSERKVSQLSQGMRMKLALALAIAPRPPLLILDEPTAGLDPVARREFLEFVDNQARATGQTVFFSSHLIDEVERVASRVGIIEAGRMVYEGSIADLRATVRAVSLPPEVPLDGFHALRALGDARVLRATAEVWAARPDVADASRALSLDDIFIALVRRA